MLRRYAGHPSLTGVASEEPRGEGGGGGVSSHTEANSRDGAALASCHPCVGMMSVIKEKVEMRRSLRVSTGSEAVMAARGLASEFGSGCEGRRWCEGKAASWVDVASRFGGARATIRLGHNDLPHFHCSTSHSLAAPERHSFLIDALANWPGVLRECGDCLLGADSGKVLSSPLLEKMTDRHAQVSLHTNTCLRPPKHPYVPVPCT